jgi:hypothetical protein
MRRAHELIEENICLLKQGIDLIERLDHSLYAGSSHPLLKYTAGGHFRHCIDFYNCFLSSVAAGRIDYDRRARDEIVEIDRAFAVAEMEEIIRRLAQLRGIDSGEEVEVVLESAPGGEVQPGRSSVGRELQFLLSHTLHHYALVAIALRLQSFSPAEEFGVSPSTLRHWRQAAGAAR